MTTKQHDPVRLSDGLTRQKPRWTWHLAADGRHKTATFSHELTSPEHSDTGHQEHLHRDKCRSEQTIVRVG